MEDSPPYSVSLNCLTELMTKPSLPVLDSENSSYVSRSFLLQKNAGVAVAFFNFFRQIKQKMKILLRAASIYYIYRNLKKYCRNTLLFALSK